MTESILKPQSNALMWGIVAVGGKFELATIERPFREGPGEVLVKIERISINRGELTFPWAPGSAIGWDAYGTVVETSDDGQGPAVGARVATWSFAGGWAEYRVVDRINLAVVPDGVSTSTAAALPVVGLTALRALRQLKLDTGKTIAITGATGGVGHLLLQLARNAGLDPTAIVRDQEARLWLEGQGNTTGHVTELAEVGDEEVFDAAIDLIGGETLSRLIPAVRPDGTILVIGNASGQNTQLDTADLVSRRIDLRTFRDYSAGGKDIAHLLDLILTGAISLRATDGGNWSRLTTEAPFTLLKRGKVTFSVDE